MPKPSSHSPRLTPGKAYAVLLDRLSRVGAVLVGAMGAVVIMGWILHIELLKSVLPGLATMKVNTAIGFLAAGAALWLIHVGPVGSSSVKLGRVLAGFVAVLGLLTLIEDVFQLHIGIDQLILNDDVMAVKTSTPGRMSPGTAFNFLFVGTALLSLNARRPAIAVCAHWLVAPPLYIAALAVVGYAYGVDALYQVGMYTSMALHTAVSFFVLSVSILSANVQYGFARIATSDTVGGMLSRWLLPAIPFTLFVLGWVRLKGEQAGLYEFHFGLALMVLISVAVCVIAVAGTAIVLHRTDITRQKAEAEVRNLNVGLERRVQERTEELAKMSEELGVANKALKQLSQQDGLTGLANRRHFDSYLHGQIAIARRHQRALALIMCDVDAFKAYNDHYGHQAGDECLKQIAAALRTCCRRPADMVARYGGEEFAVVLPDTDANGAARIAEVVRDTVARLNIPHGHSPVAATVTISGGFAAALRHTKNADQLIEAADQALYEAKHQGRNRMVSASTNVAYLPQDGKVLRGAT